MDALTACVLKAVCRFPKKQGLVGMVGVYQCLEAKPETHDFVGIRVLRRKLQARSRCDAVVVVAHPALCLFEHRVEIFCKERGVNSETGNRSRAQQCHEGQGTASHRTSL